jgi:hypothetical protein
MLKDYKGLIYGGGLFAGAAVLAATLPSDGAVCVDNHLLCAPLPVQMGDLPSEDGPRAPSPSPLTVAASTVAVIGGAIVSTYPSLDEHGGDRLFTPPPDPRAKA